MHIARSLAEFSRMTKPGEAHAVTIGNFDGVHLGHGELLRVTREMAAAKNAASMLVTFDPHPVHVLRRVASPGILTPLPRKLELLERTGLDNVLVLPFTRETAAMAAEEFVRNVLADGLHSCALVTGFNFALGRDRRGDYGALREMGLRYGFSVTRVPPVLANGEAVSSSLVREHVRRAEMDKAADLLGRLYSIDGEVVRGQARGRRIGFPTANVDFRNALLPPPGAYATWAQVLPPGSDSVPLMGMTSVGTNPTFDGGAVTLESHLFDFSGDLYGKTVRLFFVCRLRTQMRFQNAGDLAVRLEHDATAARAALTRHGGKGLS